MSKSFKDTAAKVEKPFRMVKLDNGSIVKREFKPDGSYRDSLINQYDDKDEYYFGSLCDIPF